MKCLVTGGAGFIGSHLVERLLREGAFVRVVDNFSTGQRDRLNVYEKNLNFELQEGDVAEAKICQRAMEGIDIVFHQAALSAVQHSLADPLAFTVSNLQGTIQLLTAARDQRIKKFIYASSCAIYGDASHPPFMEDSPVHPLSPYALTKYSAEQYVQFFWRLYGFPTVALRYFNVFGPSQARNSAYAPVIPLFISSFLKARAPLIYGDGNQSRDFVYVEDVVEANMLAARAEGGFGEIYNIASGREITINELVSILQGITSKTIAPAYGEKRRGEVMRSKADISKAKKYLGYAPHVSFEEGLNRTVQWAKLGHE
ncbi:MAG: SDR family oxidoreductase [Candidatus Wildermuthbacteria bacterium]|nr:SDR family oxidoreductase [Candidatus Wildermuthbacteria bacterium]